MYIHISIGEGLDRLSILEIKKREIVDEEKLVHITNEINSLNEILPYKEKYYYYYDLLLQVNLNIWNDTNDIKKITYNDSSFSKIANTIFLSNQSRFRIKHVINRLSNSSIQEQKSYGLSHTTIDITDEECINLDALTTLSLSYDVVHIYCSSMKRVEFENNVPLFNYFFHLNN